MQVVDRELHASRLAVVVTKSEHRTSSAVDWALGTPFICCRMVWNASQVSMYILTGVIGGPWALWWKLYWHRYRQPTK